MAKVHCTSFECEYNIENICKAEAIILSDGHIHTTHQGFKHIHECKTFKKSKHYKELESKIQEIFKSGEGAD